jgi:hypothetical protein
MPEKIESIFNDCFERLLMGESLESCLYRYPEHAEELDIMLRTAFDIKHKAYPIQPRPEFKYWARVRLGGVQDYMARHPVESKPSVFHWRRSWAIALSAILVFLLVTGGTAAASSEAMPDQPLYNVKLALEQTQVALTFSNTDKAELHARLAEKRAQEIANMASQGKTDKVILTTARMNYQLEQAIANIRQLEDTEDQAVPEVTSDVKPPATPVIPAAPTVLPNVPITTPPGKTGTEKPPQGPLPPAAVRQLPAVVNRAKTAIDTSNVKSITVLQNALEKAPETVKPTIKELIERTKKINENLKRKHQMDNENKQLPVRPNTGTIKPPILPPVDKSKPANTDVVPPSAPIKPGLQPKSSLQGQTDATVVTDSDENAGNSGNTSSTISTVGKPIQGVRNVTSVGPFTPVVSSPTTRSNVTSNISGSTSSGKSGAVK